MSNNHEQESSSQFSSDGSRHAGYAAREHGLEGVQSGPIEQIKEKMSALLPTMADLYVKNGRGALSEENRARFAGIKTEYRGLMETFLRTNAEKVNEEGVHEVEARTDDMAQRFVDQSNQAYGEFLKLNRSQEENAAEGDRIRREAEAAARTEYSNMLDALQRRNRYYSTKARVEQILIIENAIAEAQDKASGRRRLIDKALRNITRQDTSTPVTPEWSANRRLGASQEKNRRIGHRIMGLLSQTPQNTADNPPQVELGPQAENSHDRNFQDIKNSLRQAIGRLKALDISEEEQNNIIRETLDAA